MSGGEYLSTTIDRLINGFFMLDLIISFILGILASIIATIAVKVYKAWEIRSRFSSLEKAWIEVIPEQPDRKYSIAYFRFSFWDSRYHYDGINYYNDGERYYSWSSERTFIDISRKQILYIYRVEDKMNPSHAKYGFGSISLKFNNNKKFSPNSGYFVDTDPDGSPVRRIELHDASETAQKNYIRFNLNNEKTYSNLIKEIYKKNIL